MTYHSNKPECQNSISFNYLCTILVFIFMVLYLCLLLPGVSEVRAQENKDEMEADFLFQEPKKYLGFRIGIFSPEADSGLFDKITEELTLSKSDFRSWDFGIDFGFNVHKRIDLVFSLDFSEQTKRSEFRDWVDELDLPITQSTKFSQRPLTAGIKYLIIPRGRKIGQYAWLPSPIVPYVSGGAGILHYEFRQNGDFIRFDTDPPRIVSGSLGTSDSPFAWYLGGGTEIHIFKYTYFNLDFRYYWADDKLDSSFGGFDPIELGGYRLTAGIQWHF